MSGRTELFLCAVIAISVCAAVTDLARGRIYNWLTFPAMALGLVASTLHLGWAGLGDGLLGIVVGFLLYAWMFALAVMAGGDVKLLMALGAWGGWRYAIETALLGVILGGALAVVQLLRAGRLGGFVRRMYRFLLTVFVRELEVELPKVDRNLTMPFGLPIAAAAIWVAIDSPLARWGIRPW